MIREDIFKNKSYWENMTEKEFEEYKQNVFTYYRENGFPFYPIDMNYRKREFTTLLNYDNSKIIKDDVIKQTMHGLGLAWSYFKTSFNVRSNDKTTPLEAYLNDETFMKVIEKRLNMGTYMSDSGIRKMLKLYTGVQGVSNFRPTAAAAIYNRYAPNGYVWDMSGGWGGRLFGAIISSIRGYVCTEPCEHTAYGLEQIVNDFGFFGKEYHVIKEGSEVFCPSNNTMDLCFTSPPYFDLEKYSDEETQSYMKFKTKEEWVEGFLKKTFENCYTALKPEKHMLINIADPKRKQGISLEEATITKAKEVGFKHVDTLKLTLSNPNMRNRTSAFKYEPIFVFQKL